MDYTLNGLLSRYVLILMFLGIQLRPVFPAPTPTSCDANLNQTCSLTRLLGHETNILLDEYIKFHGSFHGSVPKDVPDSAISGNNISEKLQDIYVKNVLFYLHILEVEEYQKKTWGNPASVEKALSFVKTRLSHLSLKINHILSIIDPEILVPTTPAPPQLSHKHDYEKKVYGWGVIFKLKDWSKQVLQVLKAEKVCHKIDSRSTLKDLRKLP